MIKSLFTNSENSEKFLKILEIEKKKTLAKKESNLQWYLKSTDF